MGEIKLVTGSRERRLEREVSNLSRQLSELQASFANKVLDNESLEREHGKDVRKIENLRAEIALNETHIVKKFMARVREIDYMRYAAIPGMKAGYSIINNDVYRAMQKALQELEPSKSQL